RRLPEGDLVGQAGDGPAQDGLPVLAMHRQLEQRHPVALTLPEHGAANPPKVGRAGIGDPGGDDWRDHSGWHGLYPALCHRAAMARGAWPWHRPSMAAATMAANSGSLMCRSATTTGISGRSAVQNS